MAHFGLSNPFIAKYDRKTGMYSQGFRCGKAVATDVTPNYAEGTLYADDELAEEAKKFKYADVTMGTTELPIIASEVLFGHIVSDNQIVCNVKDKCNEVGYGFYTTEQKDGEICYWACILPCVKYGEPQESYATVGDNIEFKTPSLAGKAKKDNLGRWKVKERFTDEADAIEFIKEFLNITE